MFLPRFRSCLPMLATIAATVPMQVEMAFAQSPQPSEQTEKTGGLSGFVGVGVGAAPEYEGAREYRVLPGPQFQVNLDNRYIAAAGPGLRINILNSETFELGPQLGLDIGRRSGIRSVAVRSLGRISSSISVGAFTAINFSGIARESDNLSLSASFSVVPKKYVALGETVRRDGGATLDVGLGYSLQVTERLGVSADVNLAFANAAYANKYFGVNRAGALASGLRETQLKAGLRNIGLNLGTQYSLSDKWFLSASAGYSRILGDFADSPIVKTAGRANQFTGAIGIGWRF